MHEALLSLFHSDFGISYIRFRMTRQASSKGKVVKAPPVVHKYNQTMGGVDLGDHFLFTNEVSNIRILTFDLKDTQQYESQFLGPHFNFPIGQK
jgi:hypothetical protein